MALNHFRANDDVRTIIIVLLFRRIIRRGRRNHANPSSWLHETTPLPHLLWAKAGWSGATGVACLAGRRGRGGVARVEA